MNSREQLAEVISSFDPVEVDREYCERRLFNYVHRAWGILEPKAMFEDAWYVEAVSEHLEAVTRGEIQDLMVSIPPRLGKSLFVSAFWPSWTWTLEMGLGPLAGPGVRFLYTSYSAFLSRRDSRKTRNIIQSEWYQRLWGHRFQIVTDSNQVERFDNDQSGYRIASSVGGIGLGEGGDVLVADDPISVEEAKSPTYRQRAISWWDETMGSRLNDPRIGARVVIMQRLHQEDLIGHLLEKGNYEYLCLPMEHEPSRVSYTSVCPRGQEPGNGPYKWDQREEEGELLAPVRFGRKETEALKTTLGTYGTASQLQQRPSPRGGGLVKLAWFKRYRTQPAEQHIIRVTQSWDTANKGGQENAYSVCETWLQTETGHYLVDVYRERVSTPALRRVVESLAEKWVPSALLIEDAASGIGLIQHLQEETALPVIPVRPLLDKETRMDVETPTIEAGNIYLPEVADWLPEFESEVQDFPASTHKDQVDSFSQYLKWVRENSSSGDWNMY